MQLTKNRLESFSDGVISIIITIMVLSIPLPTSFDFKSLIGFILSIFIYFISFIVVGSFWNVHHRVFTYIDKISSRIVLYNLFYLFFLSLIPIFTKWVIENPGKLIPAIVYDLAFILVNFCSVLIFRLVINTSEWEEIKNMRQQQKEMEEQMKHETPPGANWVRFAIAVIAVALVIAVSVFIPTVSTVFLLGLPVIISAINLFSGRSGLRHDHKIKN